MPDDRFVLHRVAWKEICPWLMIARCFRLAVSLPLMFLAALGALLMPCGEYIANRVFDGGPGVIIPGTTDVSARPVDLDTISATRAASLDQRWLGGREDVRGVYLSLVRPVWNMFDWAASTSSFFRNGFVFVWNLAIWSLLGAAITRVAVVYLGRDERVSLRDALGHAARKYGWNVSAPLFPLLGVLFLLIPLAILGLFMRLDVGAFIGVLIWPLVIIATFAMAVLLVGLLFGWPLMWPTIAAEEDSDAFEAFSRSFSYTFQRPLHYLFYAALTVLLSILAWLLAANFAEGIIALGRWGISFGAGRERVAELVLAPNRPSSTLLNSVAMLRWWDWVIRMLAVSFNYSFFFCTASAIYLLLRRHVDQTDFDEVYVPDDVTRYGLPPLGTGPEGIPEVSDEKNEAAS